MQDDFYKGLEMVWRALGCCKSAPIYMVLLRVQETRILIENADSKDQPQEVLFGNKYSFGSWVKGSVCYTLAEKFVCICAHGLRLG